MSKLNKLAEGSSLMKINLKIDKELIDFNLFEELAINKDKINTEIKGQPSAYGFLGMVHKRLIKVYEEKELERKKFYAKLYIKFKAEKDSSTGRPNSKEAAEALIESNLVYLDKVREVIEAKYKTGRLEVCVKSFEQRANLIQTIAANLRKDS
jgi:hypothetical protein